MTRIAISERLAIRSERIGWGCIGRATVLGVLWMTQHSR